MKKSLLQLSMLAFVLSLLLTALGGFMDILDTERLGVLSRNHAWHDGLYLLVLAVFLRCVAR